MSVLFLEVTLTVHYQAFIVQFIVWQSLRLHIQNYVINVFSTKSHGVRQVFFEHGLVEMKSAAV